MSRTLRALVIVLLAASCGGGGGDFSAPRDLDNACAILTERPHYTRAFRAAERKWGVPMHVQMATIYQESKFIGNARTPFRYTLGVIPMGTFNYFARSLGIPETAEDAVAAICDGEVRPAAIGRVNDKVFLNNTSIGVYSAILQQREDTYKQFGRSRIAAYWSVLRALVKFYDPMTMKIEVDGERMSVKAPLAFVCNSAFQLERFALQGADEVREGKLALFLADDVGRWGLVKHAAKLAARRMQEGRDFRLVTGREIVIDPGKHKRLVVRDGEKEPMRGPYRIRLDQRGLDVIRPKAGPRPA